MEDRHFLSEPRPLSGLPLPTWEVDIVREGVDTPIMTIRVDNETLPPRKRKKKVVWKLPDTVDQTPKFGMEDKKRILELFKQHKKKSKRKARKSSIAQTGEEDDDDDSEDDEPPQQPVPPPPPPLLPKLPPPGFAKIMFITDNNKDEEKKNKKPIIPVVVNGNAKEAPPPKKVPPPPPQATAMNTSPPPGIAAPVHQPPGFRSSQPPKPPGFRSSQPPKPPGIASSQPPKPPGMTSSQQPKPITAPPPPGVVTPLRQFLVPPNSTLAQVVTETYFLLLARGLVHELGSYYAPTAQKSLTVGSAHAVCLTVEQRLRQLQSLVGMVVKIKGVLQQPSVGQGILVLITGTCVQPHALPFCHSLVLVPANPDDFENNNAGCGFHIQNDALCFLTKDD